MYNIEYTSIQVMYCVLRIHILTSFLNHLVLCVHSALLYYKHTNNTRATCPHWN